MAAAPPARRLARPAGSARLADHHYGGNASHAVDGGRCMAWAQRLVPGPACSGRGPAAAPHQADRPTPGPRHTLLLRSPLLLTHVRHGRRARFPMGGRRPMAADGPRCMHVRLVGGEPWRAVARGPAHRPLPRPRASRRLGRRTRHLPIRRPRGRRRAGRAVAATQIRARRSTPQLASAQPVAVG